MISRLLQRSIGLVPWGLRESIKSQPFIAYAQRKLLKTYLYDREFVHVIDGGPARGLRYAVTLPEDKGVWTGTYELPFSNALAAAVCPDNVCYDVGGWRGFFSGIMALRGARKVYVFEPLPENVKRIRKMIELNPALPLELFESAIGEKDGQAEFLVMPETSMGKLAESKFQPAATELNRIAVSIFTLDSLIESGRIAPPDVVKIDVEGAELLVLKGFVDALRNYRPTLFTEIHSHELAQECTSFLESLGYGVVVLETVRPPNFKSDPAVCHLLARHSDQCT